MILVICPLIGLIEDQVKEGQPLGLACSSLQDVNDLFSDDPVRTTTSVCNCGAFAIVVCLFSLFASFKYILWSLIQLLQNCLEKN